MAVGYSLFHYLLLLVVIERLICALVMLKTHYWWVTAISCKCSLIVRYVTYTRPLYPYSLVCMHLMSFRSFIRQKQEIVTAYLLQWKLTYMILFWNIYTDTKIFEFFVLRGKSMILKLLLLLLPFSIANKYLKSTYCCNFNPF